MDELNLNEIKNESELYNNQIEKYKLCMLEIIDRLNLIKAFADNPPSLLMECNQYLNNNYLMEFFCLQFRYILELIVLSSLVANEKSYKTGLGKISKPWKHHVLIKDMEKINPNFFPIPVNSTFGNNRVINLIVKKDGCLSKQEIVNLHNACSNYVHAKNPYSKPLNKILFKDKLITSFIRIQELLGSHIVKFKNSESGFLIAMTFEKPAKVEVIYLKGDLNGYMKEG